MILIGFLNISTVLHLPVGGGVFSVVLIMAKPWAEGVFVTGKQADCVLVTGFGKLPPADEPGLDRDLVDVR